MAVIKKYAIEQKKKISYSARRDSKQPLEVSI